MTFCQCNKHVPTRVTAVPRRAGSEVAAVLDGASP